MLKKILLIFLLVTFIKPIKFSKRQNSKKCTYKLKIEKLENQEIHYLEETNLEFELKISENFQLENKKNENEKYIDEKNFQKIKVNFKNSKLKSKIKTKLYDIVFLKLEKYNFIFDNKILYFKNLNIKMSPNENFFKKKKKNKNNFFFF